MAQVTGRVFIKWNGQRLPSKAGASLSYAPGNITRQMEVSDRQVEGFSQKLEAPTVDATFVHSASFDIDAIHAASDSTLVFETDTGLAYILRGAVSLSAPKLSGGEVSFQFGALSCEPA